jgi:Excalibur calcium-binding domain/Protein of unknown function (DUF1524)
MRRSPRVRLGALVAAAALGGLTGCAELSTTSASAGTPSASTSAAGATSDGSSTAPTTAGEPTSSAPAAPPDAAGTAVAALAGLDVKGRAPKTGYDRDLFGSGWGDPDRNGCDTRNDVLARDLTGESFKPGTRDCVVASGTLADPFSGTAIRFVRGQGTSDDVQIDHVVAVSDAWQKGAQAWDAGRRVAFYNDPLNLLAVDGPLNGQKGDGDAATWLPPHRGFRCAYVARQIAVKQAYELWVTAAERDAMSRVLSGCRDQPLPDADDAAGPVLTTAPARTSAAPRTPSAPGPPPAGAPFENCSAARAAGAAPVRRGDAGYGSHLDGDGDGVACE